MRPATDLPDHTGPAGISSLDGETQAPAPEPSSSVARSTIRPGLKASVVICVYTDDRWHEIQEAITSVASQTLPPWQVIIVCDHNPALAARLRTHYSELEIVANTFQPGLSGARNTGVAHAQGDIVVFLDDDARADPGWLESIATCYEDASTLGVGGMVLPDWGSAEAPRWLPEEFLWVVGCSYKGLPTARSAIRNPVGANMSFRASVFATVGAFNSSIGRNFSGSRPLGCEETEFSIRLLATFPEASIIYEPSAVVHHHVDASRASLYYFLSRCYAEGLSKARVARLAGARSALSAERHYVSHTLVTAVRDELTSLFARGRISALARLACLGLGLFYTAGGYARGSFLMRAKFRPSKAV